MSPHSCDLIFSHFILAYVDIEQLFAKAAQLLKPGGYFSIATTTQASFAAVLESLAAKEDSLVNRFTVNVKEDAVKNKRSSIPANADALATYAQQKRFYYLWQTRSRYRCDL